MQREKMLNVKLNSRQFFRKYHRNIVLAFIWGWCACVRAKGWKDIFTYSIFPIKYLYFDTKTATFRMFYSRWQRLMSEFTNLFQHKFMRLIEIDIRIFRIFEWTPKVRKCWPLNQLQDILHFLGANDKSDLAKSKFVKRTVNVRAAFFYVS